jgi:uncharacterized membrane protein
MYFIRLVIGDSQEAMILLGFFIGIVFGGLQLWTLHKFTFLVTHAGLDIKCILLGLLQLFIPFCVILGVALLRRQDILWTGIGITAVLFVGALIIFLKNRKAKGRDNNNA